MGQLMTRLVQAVLRPVVRVAAKRASRIQAGAGRIDTHIHALPPQYLAKLNKAGVSWCRLCIPVDASSVKQGDVAVELAMLTAFQGNPSGFPTPEWTPESCLESMRGIGTTLGQ